MSYFKTISKDSYQFWNLNRISKKNLDLTAMKNFTFFGVEIIQNLIFNKFSMVKFSLSNLKFWALN